MSDDRNSAGDHALLARLNALKKSSINLDAQKPTLEPSTQYSLPVDPAPARALHADLLSRFKSLTGQPEGTSVSSASTQDPGSELIAEEDGKTVEELLAELGPEESWNVPKNEEAEIEDLLSAATKALSAAKVDNNEGSSKIRENDNKGTLPNNLPSTDQPEPTEEELDQEADDYLAHILDQIKHAPKAESDDEDHGDLQQNQQHQASHPSQTVEVAFPSAPSRQLDPPSYAEVTADDELASRLANLGLPSVPTTIKTTSANPPAKQQPKGYTDEEIDSWCVICNEDATLRCIGCDGDLYCTKCWLDGHKGPDAGYEERKHKAIQYNKGGGIKKESKRRLVGA